MISNKDGSHGNQSTNSTCPVDLAFSHLVPKNSRNKIMKRIFCKLSINHPLSRTAATSCLTSITLSQTPEISCSCDPYSSQRSFPKSTPCVFKSFPFQNSSQTRSRNHDSRTSLTNSSSLFYLAPAPLFSSVQRTSPSGLLVARYLASKTGVKGKG